jgi:hypothetical protein
MTAEGTLPCEILGSHGGESEDDSFVGCSAVYSLENGPDVSDRPDDGGSTQLCHVVLFPRDYTALYPRKLFSYSTMFTKVQHQTLSRAT